MSTGLLIRDAYGNLILDGTKRVGRIIAMSQVAGPNNGSFSDARFSQGTPFCAFQRNITFHTNYGGGGLRTPAFYFDWPSNTWSWVYPGGSGSIDDIASGFAVMGVF